MSFIIRHLKLTAFIPCDIKEEMSDNAEIFNRIVENLSLLSLRFNRETFQVSSLNKDLSTLSDLINVLSEKEVEGLVFKEDLQVFVGKPVLYLLIDCSIFLG
jgi:methyl-accepting chemotaxis protein